MSKKHFMIDIETTGVSFEKDEILQLAVLEVDYDAKRRQWVPGRSLEMFFGIDHGPLTDFAKENQAALYAQCQTGPVHTRAAARPELLSFFKSCGAEGRAVFLMGLNAAGFDVQMCHAKGVLVPPGYGLDGSLVGDHHYRVYEITGALEFAADAMGIERSVIHHLTPTLVLPGRTAHDALYDCYQQLNLLNTALQMVIARGL